MQYIVNFAVPVIYMEFVFRALGIGQWLRSPELLRRPGLHGVLVEMTAEVRVEGSGMALQCNDERRLWADRRRQLLLESRRLILWMSRYSGGRPRDISSSALSSQQRVTSADSEKHHITAVIHYRNSKSPRLRASSYDLKSSRIILTILT